MEGSKTSIVISSPTSPWAKVNHDDSGNASEWRSLSDHCRDVGAVFRQLLESSVIRHRLSRLAELSDLSPSQRDRLAFLAAIHDLGKANRGFQNKGFGRSPQAGHLGEILALLRDPDPELAQELIRACRLADLIDWFREGEEGLREALYATFSHHGRPLQPPDDFPKDLWRDSDAYQPVESVRECVHDVCNEFPGAADAEPLCAYAAVMHAFLGLVTLADWIGSDERFFPLYPVSTPNDPAGEHRFDRAATAVEGIGLGRGGDGEQPVANEHDADAFNRWFGFPPNAIQQQALSEPLPQKEGSLRVLEAETGSGKTEMALAWFSRLHRAGLVDGLYFALPTRAAAVQIHERVQRFAAAAFGDTAPEVILAVPGYTPPEDSYTTAIRSDGRRYGERGIESDRGWATEHPKRYMAGRLVVGTVDQVLLSGLQVRHAHMRAAALLRHLLIVDEVHASDPYMARILEAVLQRHRAAGGHALLLSATLGEASRARLLAPGTRASGGSPEEAAARPFPALWADDSQSVVIPLPAQGSPKAISVELEGALTDADKVARVALEAATTGARIGILRNTIREAVATQQALERAAADVSLFTCNDVAAPHHSRFAREDRIRLDRALEDRLRGEGPLVVAATQTIEQSLDIDFDLLITDLCPIDVLLQRLGRLHRHDRNRPSAYEKPQAIVLTPKGDLGEFLRPKGEARGPAGLGTVYDDLAVLEGTRRVLAESPVLRIPDDSRSLIERVLHPDRLRSLAESRGGAWLDHWSHMWGVRMGQEGTADLNVADWSRPLSRTRYNEPGEAIRTRLGTDSRRLVLPTGTAGVFGGPITEITVPGWMAEGIGDEPAVETEKHPEGGLVIRADNRVYRYDRLGLRPEKEEARDEKS